ncbi:MAG: cyclodeaminase/cyclohydrolase family protein [Desulfobacterales bacterium]|nr:MAG: cyclodeaminase/cyclohydrolase family protein [Desulfobacterales bacterium]
MLANLKISDFLEQTAAGTPVPGGGSVAALNAALAASLTEMVANLTVGKKGYEAAETEMQAIARAAARLRAQLIQDIDQDAAAYNEVMAAFRLPQETEAEKGRRSRAIQEGMQKAASVPLKVARAALQVMGLASAVISKGNKNAVTDGAVAVINARSAALAALYNVKINLISVKDNAFVDKAGQEVRRIESEVKNQEKEILASVKI